MEKATIDLREWAALLVLLLVAAFLRFYQLEEIPPGWRDDELINSLVISQHVLDGEWALFYPDASGHESLFHILNAGFLALFGPGVLGIRWLSAFLGVATISLTYILGRILFGRRVGFLAAWGLIFSFWSLMYSRIGLRHISLIPFMLGAWIFLWLGFRKANQYNKRQRVRYPTEYFALSGVLLGVGLYTYFAARGIPVIVAALGFYWLIFHKERILRNWRGIFLVLFVTALLAIPLGLTISRLPAMTGRVEELAKPLKSAQAGDFVPLKQHVLLTLRMFFSSGDEEWLYNIPGRPVFSCFGAIFFVLGVLVTIIRAFRIRSRLGSESAFILFWLLAGIAPAFLSVPPASLGHTIVAQPVTYFFPALAIDQGIRYSKKKGKAFGVAMILIALAYLVGNSARDVYDYFIEWPAQGMVKYLYRADIHKAAQIINDESEILDVAITGELAGPWDRQAFLVDAKASIVDRWFDPRRALLYPGDNGYMVMTGFPDLAPELEKYKNAKVFIESKPLTVISLKSEAIEEENWIADQAPILFTNGLALSFVAPVPDGLLTEWFVYAPITQLPPFQLVSNPPPPNVDPRPRLTVFAHQLGRDHMVISVDDGLWVDPYTLRTGDHWLQLHIFSDAVYESIVEIGLYDPVTGERIRMVNGGDSLLVSLD